MIDVPMVPHLRVAHAKYLLHQQTNCVKDEIRMRLRVYAYRVREGKMTQAKMDYEIGCMEAVLATLYLLRPVAPLLDYPPAEGIVLPQVPDPARADDDEIPAEFLQQAPSPQAAE